MHGNMEFCLFYIIIIMMMMMMMMMIIIIIIVIIIIIIIIINKLPQEKKTFCFNFKIFRHNSKAGLCPISPL